MIEAVIFDMDGLLIDSEPLWRKAEIIVFNQLGVPLTEDMMSDTVGLRLDEVVSYWHTRYPWSEPGKEEVEQQIIESMAFLNSHEVELLPGVKNTLDFLTSKGLPLGLASASHPTLIHLALEHTGIKKYFTTIQSGYQEYFSKPHPEIFITTASLLGVRNENTLVFEDSFHGMIAGLAARMKVIAVPDPPQRQDPRWLCADIILDSLEQFDTAVWETINR
ncbi:MAG TPA: hexitol phosphatase HxpB [Saprospiraceae bacterium]|nr:hexitol phosphatase HxpB [Saprospiraceae bacterium]HQW56262.1 hexitol phosphatase HxpB [Saprospiraceae bacterium]